MAADIDVRDVLGAIRVPTLVVAGAQDGFTPAQGDCDDCDPDVNPNVDYSTVISQVVNKDAPPQVILLFGTTFSMVLTQTDPAAFARTLEI
jgi:pimeloyl-ACP methyl ester carboxylesterase